MAQPETRDKLGHIWVDASGLGAGPGRICRLCGHREGQTHSDLNCEGLLKLARRPTKPTSDYDPFSTAPTADPPKAMDPPNMPRP